MSRSLPLGFAVAVGILGACRPPPEAPEDLHEATAFLFETHLDPDPRVVASGLERLRAWFETSFDPEADRGFVLDTPLSSDAVEALDGSAAWHHPDTKGTRASAGMMGAAAGTVGEHAVDAYVRALTTVDQDVVFPDTFEAWSRTFRLCDGATFADGDCELLEADEQQSSAFGLGLKSVGEAYNQYRRVQLDDGQWAMNHRNWQIYPPDVTSALMEVEDQYYLNTFVPSTDGARVFRLQATWAVFGGGVPEDMALNLTAKSMYDSSEELETWLDENTP